MHGLCGRPNNTQETCCVPVESCWTPGVSAEDLVIMEELNTNSNGAETASVATAGSHGNDNDPEHC
jgi:hypothetical protein